MIDAGRTGGSLAASAAAASFACASNSRRVGGSLGRFALSRAGGSFLNACESIEPALVTEDALFRESVDMVETKDRSDSAEGLRFELDGFGGGRTGDVWFERRVGKGGASLRPGKAGDSAPGSTVVLLGRGGGAAAPSRESAAGRVGKMGTDGLRLTCAPLVGTGGGGGLAGLPGGGGGGAFLNLPGGGASKFFC